MRRARALKPTDLSEQKRAELAAACFGGCQALEFGGFSFELVIMQRGSTCATDLRITRTAGDSTEYKVAVNYGSSPRYPPHLGVYRGRVLVLSYYLYVVKLPGEGVENAKLVGVRGPEGILARAVFSDASDPPTLIAYEDLTIGRYGAWNGDALERDIYGRAISDMVGITVDAEDRVIVAQTARLYRFAPDLVDIERFEPRSYIEHVFRDKEGRAWVGSVLLETCYAVPDA